jgi:hypothetical protein
LSAPAATVVSLTAATACSHPAPGPAESFTPGAPVFASNSSTWFKLAQAIDSPTVTTPEQPASTGAVQRFVGTPRSPSNS